MGTPKREIRTHKPVSHQSWKTNEVVGGGQEQLGRVETSQTRVGKKSGFKGEGDSERGFLGFGKTGTNPEEK